MTSVKKRLDHVLNELETIGPQTDEETARNIIAELKIVQNAYHPTQNAPMCCFNYDRNKNLACDAQGPLEYGAFMEKCRVCQTQIRLVLEKLC